ncbi:MAG: DinB family protein [Dehalococcoidia bacterium]
MVDAEVGSKINALKQEYEELGTEIRETLGRLTPEDLKKKSGNPAWRVGQVAGHISKSPGGVVRFTKNVRDGKPLNYPTFVVDVYNWFGSRGSGRMKVEDFVPKYDEGHAKLAADIEASADDDWTRKTKVMGQELDMEGWFRLNMAHERDHLAELKAGL